MRPSASRQSASQADLERHGVKLGQYFVLRGLWENEGITLSQLSTRAGILDPPTDSALSAIERLGLIGHRRSDRDRRDARRLTHNLSDNGEVTTL